MLRTVIIVSLGFLLLTRAAAAQNCPAYTYTLTNGATADANQIMGNFNSILGCANNSLAPLASPHFTGSVGIGTTAPLTSLTVSTVAPLHEWDLGFGI